LKESNVVYVHASRAEIYAWNFLGFY